MGAGGSRFRSAEVRAVRCPRRRSRFTGGRRSTTSRRPQFVAQANATDPAILERFSEEHFPDCFKEYADLLTWDEYWHTIARHEQPAVLEMVRRREAERVRSTASTGTWRPAREQGGADLGARARRRGDPGRSPTRSCYRRVNEFAALLRDFCGLRPATASRSTCRWCRSCRSSMLACARLGVIHSEVFGGFSGAACGRADRRLRQPRPGHDGRLLPQRRADRPQGQGRRGDRGGARAGRRGRQGPGLAALSRASTRSATPMVEGRDFFVDELLKHYRGAAVEPVSMDAEAPLFLMYTSGTTGKPKGCQHSTGGYLAYVDRHVEVLPGHPSRGHLLVLGRHRLDHRPLVHRVRPAGARHDERHVRGRARPIRIRAAPGGSPSGWA